MSSVSKNVYIYKLNAKVNKYNNTCHGTIKKKFIDVKNNTYIDFGKENNNKDPKFKTGDHVRISNYKNIFLILYTPNWSKIDVDKLKNVPVDLSKLKNVINNEVVKKTVYDKFFTKVDAIDTSGFALKNQYNTDKSDLEKKIRDVDKKIHDTSKLVKKSDYNANITEIESKISSIIGLATTATLTAVEKRYLLLVI